MKTNTKKKTMKTQMKTNTKKKNMKKTMKTHTKTHIKTNKIYRGSGLFGDIVTSIAKTAVKVPKEKDYSARIPFMKHLNINMLNPNYLKKQLAVPKEKALTVLINNDDTDEMEQPIPIVDFYRVPHVRVNIYYPCYLVMHDNSRILWLTTFKNRMMSGSPILTYKPPTINNGQVRTCYLRLYSCPINPNTPNDLSRIFKADYQDANKRKLVYKKFFEHIRQYNLKIYGSVEIKIIASSSMNFYNIINQNIKKKQFSSLQSHSKI